jgi:hypothetical protein
MTLFDDPGFDVGDTAWFWSGQYNWSGKIVHIFPEGWQGYAFRHFVIEQVTSVDPILHIRDAHMTYRTKGERWADKLLRKWADTGTNGENEK